MASAVLVIDVQQALCAGKDACWDAAGVIARINEVTDKARQATVPVIFIQHETQFGDFLRGSPGWQLAPELRALPTDHFASKTATDAFHRTELQSLLLNLKVTDLIICGMQSDFCVDTTTRRALGLGYPVVLVSNAHTTVDNEVLTAFQIVQHHNVTLSNITSFGPGVKLVPARELQFQA